MKTKLLTAIMFTTAFAFGQKETEKAIVKTSSAPIIAYGESITLETAKKITGAAQALAVANQWTMAIAIVDTGGNLVLFEKMDNTQIGSIEVAMGKARTANNFKRPTKAFEDVVANGGPGLRVLAIPGVFPIEGGEPIIVNGKIIGAIGVSGMSSAQDEEVAKAGLAALK
jgi:glc operon protein GlcG